MKHIKKTFNGSNKNGKNILLIAGVHGDEITPIYALMLILKNINLLDLSKVKTLTIVNGINETGIKNHTREIVKNKTNDLNRSFIETDIDSVSELQILIDENDVIIDIHSSPSCIEFALIDIDEFTMSLKEWCDISLVPTAYRYSSANTIKRYSLLNNKLSLTLEINKLNIIDIESAKNAIIHINNLLLSVDNIELIKSEPIVKELFELKTYNEGIFLMKNNEKIISKGDILGEIFDLSGNLISTIKSPINGIIITTPGNTYINRGETIFMIQPL